MEKAAVIFFCLSQTTEYYWAIFVSNRTDTLCKTIEILKILFVFPFQWL